MFSFFVARLSTSKLIFTRAPRRCVIPLSRYFTSWNIAQPHGLSSRAPTTPLDKLTKGRKVRYFCLGSCAVSCEKELTLCVRCSHVEGTNHFQHVRSSDVSRRGRILCNRRQTWAAFSATLPLSFATFQNDFLLPTCDIHGTLPPPLPLPTPDPLVDRITVLSKAP